LDKKPNAAYRRNILADRISLLTLRLVVVIFIDTIARARLSVIAARVTPSMHL
jgi:hypothetical protein